MTRKPVPSMSVQARLLQQQVNTMVIEYESSLGSIPVWFAEIDTCAALSLIAACLRIGMRLPAVETLQEDMLERAKAQRNIRVRRPYRAD